jgi:hypothetical protein
MYRLIVFIFIAMINPKLEELLKKEGYFDLREIPGRGVCGLTQFAFTVGIVYGLHAVGYEGRYCYPRMKDAVVAFHSWNGEGDPSGPWIKHKGTVEYRNPNLEDEID